MHPACVVSRPSRPAVVLAVIVLAACGSLGFEAEVTGRTPFDPPGIYESWYDATRTCSARWGSFERVRWWLASGITGDGAVALARWSEPHEIVIVFGYQDDEKVVRHEMLHDLLAGDRGHGSPAWDACDLRFD